MQADVVTGGQGQAATDLAGQVGQGAAGVVEHIENLISPWQQGATRLGQTDFATQSIKQAYLQLLLKPGDALADRRLGQMKAFAGAGEAAGLGDGNKSIQVSQIHVAFQLVIQSIKNMNLSYLI